MRIKRRKAELCEDGVTICIFTDLGKIIIYVLLLCSELASLVYEVQAHTGSSGVLLILLVSAGSIGLEFYGVFTTNNISKRLWILSLLNIVVCLCIALYSVACLTLFVGVGWGTEATYDITKYIIFLFSIPVSTIVSEVIMYFNIDYRKRFKELSQTVSGYITGGAKNV